MKISFLIFCTLVSLFYMPRHAAFSLSSTAPPVTLKPFQKSRSIVWDTGTLCRISPADTPAFYPRMTQLNDGSLLVVYAASGNVVGQKSSNGGKSWTTPAIIAERQNDINRDTPELLQLQNGDLIICYGSRPQGAMHGKPQLGKRFDIRIKKSKDNGTAWVAENVLYEAGISSKNGCWEPAMVQLPSGELQLFFANEGIYPNSDEQNISLLQSTDNGQSWSTVPKTVSFRKRSRDGMPVPLWLAKTGELAVAIEDPGVGNFKPYIIRSGINGRWHRVIDAGHARREYALAAKPDDSVYAGAPYLRQLSTGETILSYQSTEGRKVNKDYNAVMAVAVGDQQARKFAKTATPFTVPEGRNALWNSVCVLKNDTIVALTSTNAFSTTSEIWMVKGTVKQTD